MSQRRIQTKLASEIHPLVTALAADLAIARCAPGRHYHVSLQASIQEAVECLGDRSTRSRYQAVCTLCWRLALTCEDWAHGWAHHRIKVLTDHNLTPQDVVQEMLIGLFHAAWTYNPASGARFLTYASHRAVVRALRVITKAKPVHLPEWKFAQNKMLRRLRDEHPGLSVGEIAARAGVTMAQVQDSADLTSVSLDAPSRADDKANMRLHDVLADERDIASEIGEADYARRAATLVVRAIDTLPPRQRMILRARSGLHKNDVAESETLAAVGRQMKLSRERVRQLEQDALKTLSRDRDLNRLVLERSP